MIVSKENIVTEYSNFLNTYGLSFTESEIHYHVGVPSVKQGWKIHVSIIVSQLSELIEKFLPVIIANGASFKMVKNKFLLNYVNAGFYDISLIGKIITIYPESNEAALRLANELLAISDGLKGPAIVTDFYLGGVIYTRYGSFDNDEKVKSFIDGLGNEVPDIYFIPAITPAGIENPFKHLIKPNIVPTSSKILHKKYLIKDIIGFNVKGNILKGIFLKGFRLKVCLIKQGRENIISDDAGRDMKARLLWQKEVYLSLTTIPGIPLVYDYFEEEGNGYLVIEFIKGRPFNQVVNSYLKNGTWPNLPLKSKMDILGLLTQIVSAITMMHAKGFIHRDIAATNFLIKKGKIFLIDLELAFSHPRNFPNPAFTSGTVGYMAPEQFAMKEPDFPVDIYSLGALMIFACTGIEAVFLIEKDREKTKNKLEYLISNSAIVDLIMSCIERDPNQRPVLSFVKEKIEEIKQGILKNRKTGKSFRGVYKISADELHFTIQKGIDGLAMSNMLANNLWLSERSHECQTEKHATANRVVSPMLHTGTSGVLIMLSRAKHLGFDLTAVSGIIENSFNYLSSYIELNHSHIPPGLYYGSSGIARALFGFYNNELPDLVTHLLFGETTDLNLMNGKAGIGLAILKCPNVRNTQEGKIFLERLASEIISRQLKDGSWLLHTYIENKKEKINGFAYGIAGIVYFLLEYWECYKKEEALAAALNGLHYLKKVAVKKDGNLFWHNSDRNKSSEIWWCRGASGIALAFLKALKVLGDDAYRNIVLQAITGINSDFIHFNLTQCHGLSSLNEIYIEAGQLLKSDECKKMSDWITKVLMTMSFKNENGSLSWLAETVEFSNPDLMIGMSGIIHSLLHYLEPNSIEFPIL